MTMGTSCQSMQGKRWDILISWKFQETALMGPTLPQSSHTVGVSYESSMDMGVTSLGAHSCLIGFDWLVPIVEFQPYLG